jgi:small subunit ribosomal protein S34
MFERYPEKTFYRIVKAEALSAPVNESIDDVRKMKVWVQKVFRGRLFKNPVLIESASYKCDYKLLSKKEEKDYCQILTENSQDVKLIAPEMEVPPLLKELISRETGKNDVKMKLSLKYSYNKQYRIAQEDEKPTVQFPINIGKPLSPSLYKGLEL